MLQTLLVPLNNLDNFSILSMVTSSNPLYFTMRMVSSPYCGPLSLWTGDQISYTYDCNFFLIDNQRLDVDFHPWRSNLKLIIELQEYRYNNLNHAKQLCLRIGPMLMAFKTRSASGGVSPLWCPHVH